MPSLNDNDGLRRFFKRSGCQKDARTLLCGAKMYPDSDSRHDWYTKPIGLDMQGGPGVDLVHDLEEPIPDEVGMFGHVDCCSVLEHVKRPWKAAQTIEAVMPKGATLLVSVPFVWRVHGYPKDYWRMTPEALVVLFEGIGWRDMRYLSNGEVYARTPAHEIDGRKCFERTEVIAWGVRE